MSISSIQGQTSFDLNVSSDERTSTSSNALVRQLEGFANEWFQKTQEYLIKYPDLNLRREMMLKNADTFLHIYHQQINVWKEAISADSDPSWMRTLEGVKKTYETVSRKLQTPTFAMPSCSSPDFEQFASNFIREFLGMIAQLKRGKSYNRAQLDSALINVTGKKDYLTNKVDENWLRVKNFLKYLQGIESFHQKISLALRKFPQKQIFSAEDLGISTKRALSSSSSSHTSVVSAPNKRRKLSSAVVIKEENPTDYSSYTSNFTTIKREQSTEPDLGLYSYDSKSLMKLLEDCRSKEYRGKRKPTEDNYKMLSRNYVLSLDGFFCNAISSIERFLNVLERKEVFKERELREKRSLVLHAAKERERLNSKILTEEEKKQEEELWNLTREYISITEREENLRELKFALEIHSGAIKGLTRNPAAQRFFLQECGTFENLDVELRNKEFI